MSVERDDELAYRAAIAAGDDSAWDALGRVLSAQPDGAQKAEAAFRMAIARGVVGAWNSLGWLLTGQPGREEEAEAAYRNAIAAGNIFAPSNLGYLLQRQPGREHDAEAVYRAGLAAGIVHLWSNLAGLLSTQAGREDEAEQAYREAIATGNSEAWRGLLRLLARQPGREDAAERAFREAAAAADAHASGDLGALRREFALALMDKGLALDAAGRHHDALAVYGDVVARFGSDEDPQLAWRVAWALVDKGLALQQLGRPGAAVVEFDAAYRRIVALPNRDEDLLASALLNKCEALLSLDRLDEAVSVCDLALEHFAESIGEGPGHRDRCAWALMLKARALRDAGDQGAAIAVYDEVVERFGDDEGPNVRRRVAWAMSFRAELHYAAGRYDESLHALDALLDRFGAAEDDEQRPSVEHALSTKADLLRLLGRHTEALIVYDSATERAQRLAAQHDDPHYVQRAIRNLFERASVVQQLERLEEAVAARERAFALIEPPVPAWMHDQLGLALVGQANELELLGEHEGAAQMPRRALALLGGMVDVADDAASPRPSDEHLAQVLAETLSGDCFEHFAAPAEDRPRELYAARAIALYRETTPVLSAPRAFDEIDEPSSSASGILRMIANAYALLTRSGTLDEHLARSLPTPARVGLAVRMSGLDHWSEDHGQAVPALGGDDDELWEGFAAAAATDDDPALDEQSFARAFTGMLRTYDVVAALRGARDGREVLRAPRMRDYAIDHIARGQHCMGLVSQHDEELLPLALAMLLIAECWYAAAWTKQPLHDEWFPSRAFLRELLDAPDGLSALTALGAQLPDWLG